MNYMNQNYFDAYIKNFDFCSHLMGMVASATDSSTNQKHGRMLRQHVSMLSMDHWLPLMTGQISDDSS